MNLIWRIAMASLLVLGAELLERPRSRSSSGQADAKSKKKREKKAPVPEAKGLSGRIVLASKSAPPPQKIPIGVDTSICGTANMREALLISGKGGVKNAVVSLVKPPADGKQVLPSTVTMGQQACVFGPHVLLVPKGGTVRFSNADPIIHNVRVSGPALSINRAATKDVTIEQQFRQLGIHPVRCDFHAWMKAYILVVDHPYYTITDEEGRFSFDVPPGTYDVKVWHETMGTLAGTIVTGKPNEMVYPESKAVVPPLGQDAASDWN